MSLTRWLLLIVATAILAAGLALYHTGKLKSALNPEHIQQPVFVPLQGAQADRAVYEARNLSAQDLSTTLPITTTVAELPLSQFMIAVQEDSVVDEGDTHIHTGVAAAKGARLVRFENPDLCQQNQRCLYGLFAQAEDQPHDFAHPIFLVHAKNVMLSSNLSAGNPDLIVDYGPPLGKRRFVWATENEQFPDYTDAGPVN